jgi:hypothetical protein
MDNEQWIKKNVKGSGRGLIEVLSRIFHGETEENYAKPHSLEQVSVARFKPVIFRTESRVITVFC